MLVVLGALAVALNIASFAGWVWLLVVGFKESVESGLLVLLGLCCCLGPIAFAFKHWELAKRPFLLYLLSGLLAVPVGAALQVRMQGEMLQRFNQRRAELEERTLRRPDLELDGGSPATEATEPQAPTGSAPTGDRPDWAVEVEQAQKVKEDAPPPEEITEAKLLFRVRGSAEEQLLALKTWRKRAFDGEEGARLRMLNALGLPLEPHVRKIILESLAERPLTTSEALECLSTLQLSEGLRTPVLQGLCRAGGDDAPRVAEVVGGVDETATLLVEEILVRMQRPRAGALGRLLTARGHEWATSPSGVELLTILARDAKELDPLLSSEREDLRGLACDLVEQVEDPKAALKVLVGRLKDDAPAVRQRAAAAIEARSDPAVTWYLALAIARETNDGVRSVLIHALRSLPLDKTVIYLRKLYAKKNPKARIAALEAARALRNYSATQVLLRALYDTEDEVLVKALEALDATAADPKLKQSVSPGLRNLRALTFDESKSKEVRRLAKRVYYTVSGQIPKR